MIKNTSLLLLLLLLFWSCEREFTPPQVDDVDDIVVEGYIEAGPRPTAPYVLLTRAQPFFSEIGGEALNDFFVRGAEVRVSDGTRTVQLTELCLDELPPELQEQAAELFGLGGDSIAINICAYVDVAGDMVGQEGRKYELEVRAEGKVLTATTTIPLHVPLDSLYFRVPPGEVADTLAELRVVIDDPSGEDNFYRYFTQINDRPLRAPNGSVTDDRLFDGQRFEFPLPRASEPGEDFDFSTFGLYTRGDTATIKWICLDEAHFNFFNTVEFLRNNQGPFSSYSRVDHNIEGGLGIWGGLSASYYELAVPEK